MAEADGGGGCLLGVNFKQEARNSFVFKLLCPRGGFGRRANIQIRIYYLWRSGCLDDFIVLFF